MSVLSHYYTRGYRFVRSADGNHTPPTEKIDGYCSVGCSRTLGIPVLESIESARFLGFASNVGTPVKSLYFYPRFSLSKGLRFGLLGQVTTHPEGNFIDDRSNYFVHNYIFNLGDINNYILSGHAHEITRFKFRESYVDADASSGDFAELAYQNCIDEPFDSFESIPRTDTPLQKYSLSLNQTKSLILALSKQNPHAVVCLGESNVGMDQNARAILHRLYKYMPLGIMNSLGFITCMNSSIPQPSCNLVFCNNTDYNRIYENGFGSVTPNEISFISFINENKNLLPEQVSISADDRAYIDWLSESLCSDDPARSDIAAMVRTVEKQVIELLYKKNGAADIPFTLSSRIFKYVAASNEYSKNKSEKNSTALVIACFALMYTAACISNDYYEILMPYFRSSMELINDHGAGFSDEECTKLILAFDNRKPETLTDLCNRNEGSKFVSAIEQIRTYNKNLAQLLETSKKILPHSITPSTIADVAIDRYEKNEYNREWSAYGCDIAYNIYRNYGTNAQLTPSLHKLWKLSMLACKNTDTRAFNVANLEQLLDLLAFLSRIKFNVNESTCDTIMADIAKKDRIGKTAAMERIVRVPSNLSRTSNGSDLMHIVVNYLLKLKESEKSIDMHSLYLLCERSKQLEQFSDILDRVLSFCSSQFNLCVAQSGNSLGMLSSIAELLKLRYDMLPRFVSACAEALVVMTVMQADTIPVRSKAAFSPSDISSPVSIIQNLFVSCSSDDTNTVSRQITNTLLTVPLISIGGISLNRAVADAYNFNNSENLGTGSVQRRRKAAFDLAEARLRNGSPRSAQFDKYLKSLPVMDYPVYTGSLLDDLYQAITKDEDRAGEKESLLQKTRRLDAGKFLPFSNSNYAQANRLFAAAIDSGAYKFSKEFSSTVAEMFREKVRFVNDNTKPVIERFSAFVYLTANYVYYDLAKLFACDIALSIPMIDSSKILGKASVKFADDYAMIIEANVFGGNPHQQEKFCSMIRSCACEIDRKLCGISDENAAIDELVRALEGRFDYFCELFPQATSKWVNDAKSLCDGDSSKSSTLSSLANAINKRLYPSSNIELENAFRYITENHTPAKKPVAVSVLIILLITGVLSAALIGSNKLVEQYRADTYAAEASEDLLYLNSNLLHYDEHPSPNSLKMFLYDTDENCVIYEYPYSEMSGDETENGIVVRFSQTTTTTTTTTTAGTTTATSKATESTVSATDGPTVSTVSSTDGSTESTVSPTDESSEPPTTTTQSTIPTLDPAPVLKPLTDGVYIVSFELTCILSGDIDINTETPQDITPYSSRYRLKIDPRVFTCFDMALIDTVLSVTVTLNGGTENDPSDIDSENSDHLTYVYSCIAEENAPIDFAQLIDSGQWLTLDFVNSYDPAADSSDNTSRYNRDYYPRRNYNYHYTMHIVYKPAINETYLSQPISAQEGFDIDTSSCIEIVPVRNGVGDWFEDLFSCLKIKFNTIFSRKNDAQDQENLEATDSIGQDDPNTYYSTPSFDQAVLTDDVSATDWPPSNSDINAIGVSASVQSTNSSSSENSANPGDIVNYAL